MYQIISLYKHNAFVRIQDKAKLLASVEERNNKSKNNSIYSIM